MNIHTLPLSIHNRVKARCRTNVLRRCSHDPCHGLKTLPILRRISPICLTLTAYLVKQLLVNESKCVINFTHLGGLWQKSAG